MSREEAKEAKEGEAWILIRLPPQFDFPSRRSKRVGLGSVLSILLQ